MIDRRPHEQMKELVALALAGDGRALEAVVRETKDDVYNLALRMLGRPATAEDATQEILIQVITHLGQWRAEASLRTWVWRIAVRHLLRQQKTEEEQQCSFDALEGAIAAGSGNPPLPALEEAELAVLEKELRLNCTEAMILSLDREHRIAWILGEVFELESPQAAEVLDLDAATYRKRLQRARARLGRWMHDNCGVANPKNPCHCRRQIPVAIDIGVVDPDRLLFANHSEIPDVPRKRLSVLGGDADEIMVAAQVLCSHPRYSAPERLVTALRHLIAHGGLRLFDA